MCRGKESIAEVSKDCRGLCYVNVPLSLLPGGNWVNTLPSSIVFCFTTSPRTVRASYQGQKPDAKVNLTAA